MWDARQGGLRWASMVARRSNGGQRVAVCAAESSRWYARQSVSTDGFPGGNFRT